MTAEQEIQTLKVMVASEQDAGMKERIIKTLETYGFKARASLFDLLAAETDGQRKNFILEQIQSINHRINK